SPVWISFGVGRCTPPNEPFIEKIILTKYPISIDKHAQPLRTKQLVGVEHYNIKILTFRRRN
ncbi:hypothetical protein ACVGWK_09280, partial [Enterobacter sichuanensis]